MLLTTLACQTAPAAAAGGVAADTVKDLSVWQLCMEGGWLMIPLAILSLVSIYVLIERAIVHTTRHHDEDDEFHETYTRLYP